MSLDFAMNDKCAAGTGRFLEAMARALQVDIDDMADMDIGAEGKTDHQQHVHGFCGERGGLPDCRRHPGQ